MRCRAIFAVVLSTFLMSTTPSASAGPKASAKVSTKSPAKASKSKAPAPKTATKKKVVAKAKPKKQSIPDLTPEGLPNVLSGSVVVLDLETGDELFSKNPTAMAVQIIRFTTTAILP